jgi:hypothetical protein
MARATSFFTQSSKRWHEEPNLHQPDYCWHSRMFVDPTYYTIDQAIPVEDILAHIALLWLRQHRFRTVLSSLVDRQTLASDTT